MADFNDHLKSLHTALIDSREGYEEALADADGKGLSALFRDFISLRSRHHREIDQLLRQAGEAPDESGSFMTTVHRTIMKVRSLFGGLDESVLPGLIDGEKRIVGYYDEALKDAPPAPAASVLSAQKREIETKIAEMESMKKP